MRSGALPVEPELAEQARGGPRAAHDRLGLVPQVRPGDGRVRQRTAPPERGWSTAGPGACSWPRMTSRRRLTFILAVTLMFAGGARCQDAPLPAPCPAVGGLDHYRCRARDAVRRRPGAAPPSYYLAYGDRYARRFTEETRPLLSPAGRRWLDRTRRRLQEAIEARRASDPAGFAALEVDAERFADFAYATHPAAYLEAGLAGLPARDLVLIATTPDVQDLLTSRGLAQVGAVLHGLLRTCRAEGAAGCAMDRALREARERRRLLADGLGLRPAGLVGRFLARRAVGSALRALGLERPAAEGLRGAVQGVGARGP